MKAWLRQYVVEIKYCYKLFGSQFLEELKHTFRSFLELLFSLCDVLIALLWLIFVPFLAIIFVEEI